MSTKRTKQPNPLKVPLTYLNADVYGQWKRWCKERGLIQQSYMSKVITFIMELDESTRTLFLKAINEEDRMVLTKQILERMSTNGHSGAEDGKGPPASAATGVVARAKSQTRGGLGTRQNKKKQRSSRAG